MPDLMLSPAATRLVERVMGTARQNDARTIERAQAVAMAAVLFLNLGQPDRAKRLLVDWLAAID